MTEQKPPDLIAGRIDLHDHLAEVRFTAGKTFVPSTKGLVFSSSANSFRRSALPSSEHQWHPVIKVSFTASLPTCRSAGTYRYVLAVGNEQLLSGFLYSHRIIRGFIRYK